MKNRRYKPIADYGAIGNGKSVALVGRDGSIDWCCFPNMDSPSVFAALLDAGKGGRFRISLPGAHADRQEYVSDSNVLRTTLITNHGKLLITDFMPLEGDIIFPGRSVARPEIHRVLECEGELDVEVEWVPRLDYGRVPMNISGMKDGWLAAGGDARISLSRVENASVRNSDSGPMLQARFGMKQGERRVIITRWSSDFTGSDLEDSVARMKQTEKIWFDWAHMEESVHAEDWAGEFLPLLIRAELVFKMLTFAETGAVAAAPTTSLPEDIGGVRNWDYRYAWIRDASLTAQALISLGHKDEAIHLLNWFEDVSNTQREDIRDIRVMYTLMGETSMDEYELTHFEGYRGSSPVRIGNGAAKQFQLDGYGEILSIGYELLRRGEKVQPEIMKFLSRTANNAAEVWHKPDHGIWEVRNGPRHYTYSKLMAWVALDRAVRLYQEYNLAGDVAKWITERDKIGGEIIKLGFSEEIGAFTQTFDSQRIDAANLRIPLLQFLPAGDPRVQSTVDRILEQLTEKGLVYRYTGGDELPGKEGAFGLCSFWLVDVLGSSGRLNEARDIFSQIVSRANHVGLFPEQFDPHTGEHLGNFPHVFTHIGLINSVIFMALAEGKKVPGLLPLALANK